MKIVQLDSWEAFKDQMRELYSKTEALRLQAGRHVSTPVFRGQADSDWRLQTTLEREFPEEMSLEYYYSNHFLPVLRVLRGVIDVDLSESPKAIWKIRNTPIRDIVRQLPLVEQMAMLRHHGGISPLLDWTYSPYVAAYFAFNSGLKRKKDMVAIFVFQEYRGKGRRLPGRDPCIEVVGRWMPVHVRHIQQQSLYTVCVRNRDNVPVFSNHEIERSEVPSKRIESDGIIKFEIPTTEQQIALKDLTRMNVTEYSLFNTQDALVKTVSRIALEPE